MSSGILVHPTAKMGERFAPSPFSVIDQDVRIGDDVTLGSFVHVHPGAVIGSGTVIGDHVTIGADAKLGVGCVIADFAYIGKRPKLSPTSTAKVGELKGLVLGDGCAVGSHTVLMAGTVFGTGCVVGDNAGVRERCRIGDTVVVGRSVTVENDTEIGSRTKIQSGAYVTAYVVIEEDCFIAPMVVTTNDNYMGRTEKRFKSLKGCTIRRGARVGGGSHILPGIEIGEEAFVATGSVVTRDVPAGKLVMGVPAKVVKDVPEDELLDNA
ncbi:MAG: DapH/DapD/GlmU-related protein [Coriobacteriia bacterium]|nr:DapH/DapD/GlmU-related protein [Coriobacteriia bacterium]